MKTAHVNGVRIAYEIFGEGEPMILVGGPGFGRDNFAPSFPFLGKHYSVLSFDQRGYGESETSGVDDATIETWADDAVGLMDAIGWERAHVHGTSYGSAIALALADRHPERCSSLIWNAYYAKPDGAWRLHIELTDFLTEQCGLTRPLAGFLALRNIAPDYLDEHPETVDGMLAMLQTTPLETWRGLVRALKVDDVTQILPRVRTPTLVVSGELDLMLDLSPSGCGMRRIPELMPDARLEVLEGVGHVSLLEAPELHVAAVLAFTSGLAGRSLA